MLVPWLLHSLKESGSQESRSAAAALTAALFQMKIPVLSVSALSDLIIKTILKYYPIPQQKTLALYVPLRQEEASLRADPGPI